MRILFFGNNWVGWQVAKWLKEYGEEIVGVVIHPAGKRKFGDEIIESSNVSPEAVFDGSQLRQPETIEAVRALQPEIGISVLFDYILNQEFLDLLPSGCLNLHPSFLPYNRGNYPNVWSIIEGTPAGATLHYMDKGLDTGDIIAQREIEVEPVETGATLYRKLEQTSVALFQEAWPAARAGALERRSQKDLQEGTYHRARDVEKIDEIKLDQTYVARDLLNVLRARTFPPYRGAYFVEQGRKVYLSLQLTYEDEWDAQQHEEREHD
ncbi:MAG: methionyl-tRNA formyltransferase [Pyrinomonadaceae bacterium]